MTRKLKTSDEVIVICGNDKGRKGKILSFNGDRVVVEGINVRKKNMRATRENQKGQILDIECPIHISNVAACVEDKAVKLRTRIAKSGEKEVVYLDANKKQVPFRTSKPAKKGKK